MKTPRKCRILALLVLCSGLAGCTAGLDVLLTGATVGATYFIMDHETDRAINAQKEMLSGEGGMFQDAWMRQCMSENQHYWAGIEDEKKRRDKRDDVLDSCRRLMHETNDVN